MKHLRYFNTFVERYPIATQSRRYHRRRSGRRTSAIFSNPAIRRRRLLADWYRHSLDIATIPNALRDPFALDPNQFIAAIRKARPKAKLLSAASVQHIREEHAGLVAPMARRLAEAARLERRLSDLVNEAYGLTPDDVALMWRTAPPPRMPIAAP